mgnify:CR=1 FL=1
MKHKNLKVLFIGACISITIGACVAEQITLEDNQNLLQDPKTRGIQNLDDAELIAVQTDLYALLAKQVQCIDSVYSLAISREVAKILNIPDSIYDKFEHVIIQLNNTKK